MCTMRHSVPESYDVSICILMLETHFPQIFGRYWKSSNLAISGAVSKGEEGLSR